MRQGRIVAGILVMLACIAGPAMAEVAAEILDYGLTTGRRVQGDRPPQPGEMGLAPSSRMADIRHVVTTNQIVARLCRSFGMTVRLTPDASGRIPGWVDVRTLHPVMTRPDGVQGQEGRFRSEVSNGTTYAGFSFDYDWEMTPGTWTFVMSVDGREIARKTFTISLPPPGSPRSECEAESVS